MGNTTGVRITAYVTLIAINVNLPKFASLANELRFGEA